MESFRNELKYLCTEGELRSRLVKIKEALAAQGRAVEEEGGKKNALQLLIQPIKAVTEPIKAVTQPVKAMLGMEGEPAEETVPSVSPAAESGAQPVSAPPKGEQAAQQEPVPHKKTEEKGCGNHEDTCHF